MRKNAGLDLATFYRAALTDVDINTMYAAVSGIGETGSVEDAGKILPYCTSDVTKVRRAAIAALARLSGDQYTAVFTKKLSQNDE